MQQTSIDPWISHDLSLLSVALNAEWCRILLFLGYCASSAAAWSADMPQFMFLTASVFCRSPVGLLSSSKMFKVLCFVS